MNAVLESGATIYGSYEAAMGTFGKQLSSLDRIHKDFMADMGNFALDIVKTTGALSRPPCRGVD